jgi:ribosomal protein S18 acetylase RimI-like enzyme
MPFVIRKAVSTDLSSVIDLIREFAAYEDLSSFCETTEEKLEAVTFGPDAFVECLVAFDDGNLAGYAMIYPSFASFRGQRGMYLEDIFIRAEYRGTGLGHAMLKEIAQIARSRGCERIDFLVLDWNTPAIGFYEKHGAVRDEQERHFKFVGEAFDQLAS